MVRRTARQGSNPGSQFWGCPAYPSCEGIRDIGEGGRGAAGEPDRGRQPTARLTDVVVPVDWTEGSPRTRFNYEYAPVGSAPGVLREHVVGDETLKRLLTHTLLLSAKNRVTGGATEHARLTSALLAKLLQRGYAPLPTLEVERAALKCHGLIDAAEDLSDDEVEVGWRLSLGATKRDLYRELAGELIDREPFALADEARASLLQSDAEVEFLTNWVPQNLGSSAGHWLMPQAPLDTLLESATLVGNDRAARRIDFLVCHPGGEPWAIELDGPEHLAAQATDSDRDKDLSSIGIEVVRVTNDEVFQGTGTGLDRIRDRFNAAQNRFAAAGPGSDLAKVASDCSIASKVQFAIARAIGYGWLNGDQWDIELSGAGDAGTAGVLDALRLISSFDVLYGGRTVPERCTVRNLGEPSVTWKLVDGEWTEEDGPEGNGHRISIVVERRSSPFSALAQDTTADFIIRPAFLPVKLAVEQRFEYKRRPISPESYEHAEPALTTFLRTIFRKYQFRQQQGEAVFNALRQNDSVVLLPTGAGKSIIYQLAGLLMPGMTIVVDPIVALIEDQVEGLQSHGIDRAAGIVTAVDRRVDRDRLLRQIERGEYQFVLHTPERLQSPEFRGTLEALREISLVNLAVIDEAHCVSEWGHDFRPAYLNLANNLRKLAMDPDGNPPPLLALTGTASRAVLRDMLSDLGIDSTDSNALIRPESFDRPELSFDIRRATVGNEAQAKLRGVMNNMPGRFGMARAQFYSSNGRDTASGIVFTRTVDSRVTGLIPTMEEVRKATKSQIVLYSGRPPRGIEPAGWERQKRENAAAFKRNEVPVLVATKAFGMGIDKPNIRYIVHFGMPGSLESLYQEAGRAGRDQKPAHCVTIFTEYNPDRSDGLLDPRIGLSELRKRFEFANRDRSTGDDVTSAMFFHLRSFGGSQSEVQVVESVLNGIADLDTRHPYRLPYSDDDDKRRKEHAVVRLLRVGVFSDYEVEFGSRRMTIQVERFDFGRCRQSLLDYVQTAQPHRSKEFGERLAAIVPGNAHSDALELARLLVEFTYDVIERSRRRTIQEAVLLGRSAESDGVIRSRLMDYLQEGLHSGRIDELLEQQNIELEPWWELIETVQTPVDAGELRGLCIRSLESYPNHPGLLLARAAAEAMCSDHDDSASWEGIRDGIAACSRVPEHDVRRMVQMLYGLASSRAGELGAPLTMGLLEIGQANPEFAFCTEIAEGLAPDLPNSQEDIELVLSVYGLLEGVRVAEALTGRVVQRYGRSRATELLGGNKK